MSQNDQSASRVCVRRRPLNADAWHDRTANAEGNHFEAQRNMEIDRRQQSVVPRTTQMSSAGLSLDSCDGFCGGLVSASGSSSFANRPRSRCLFFVTSR